MIDRKQIPEITRRLRQRNNRLMPSTGWRSTPASPAFGLANPRPVFHAMPVEIVDGPRPIKDRHLSMTFRQDGRSFRAIAWRAAERAAFLTENRDEAFDYLRLALTEPQGGSDVAALTTRARRDGDDWLLDGEKQFITNTHEGNVFLVVARTRRNTSRGLGSPLRSVRRRTTLTSGPISDSVPGRLRLATFVATRRSCSPR